MLFSSCIGFSYQTIFMFMFYCPFLQKNPSSPDLFDQSVQVPEQELATSWGVSRSCQEYSQMLEHNPFLDNMESDMLWLLFILHCQCLLPALQSSVFFTYGPLVYVHGLETNSAVYQSCVVYKPKERVNKGLNCLKQWMCPDEFGVIQTVFFSYL